MVRCFLTGVQIPMECAFVLNRRDAGDLVAALNDRVASLRRVVEQVSALDDAPVNGRPNDRTAATGPRKKHRLVCKAVADTLMQAFPEIRLFMPWPEYQAQATATTLASLRAHPTFGEAIKVLTDDELGKVDKRGRAVLHMVDPERALSKKIRLAIVAAACIVLREHSAAEVAQLIGAATVGDGEESSAVGLTREQLRAVRAVLQAKSGTR